MENIEERPVQEIRGSYIVYLPKEWCKENNLVKGSRVRMKYVENRLIIEAPSRYSEDKIVEIYLDKVDIKSMNYILISLYLLGINKIKIISKRNISLKDRRDIRRIIEAFTRYTISYEGKNFIELHSGYTESNTWQLIFKAFNSMESILSYYLDILSTQGRFEYEDLEEIEAIDNEVDFLRRDLERIHSKSLLKMESSIDLKSQDILVRIAIIIERMVDHLNAVAKLGFKGNVDLAILPEYIAKLRSIVNHLTEIIYEIRDSYLYSRKLHDFEKTLSILVNIIKEREMFHSILKRDVVIDIVKYHILRLYDYITDITELLIDWVVKINYIEYNHMSHID